MNIAEDDEPILEIVIKSGEQQDYNLDSLAKFANYSIQLLARTRKGDGIESDPVYCKTLEDGTFFSDIYTSVFSFTRIVQRS